MGGVHSDLLYTVTSSGAVTDLTGTLSKYDLVYVEFYGITSLPSGNNAIQGSTIPKDIFLGASGNRFILYNGSGAVPNYLTYMSVDAANSWISVNKCNVKIYGVKIG